MEPIEETRQVLESLAKYGDDQTAGKLAEMSRVVAMIVPDCVGISISLVETGITFTLAATSEEIAGLDAIQYLDGGPCVAAVDDDEVVVAPGGAGALDEAAWQLHARATAAASVRSTLSVPIKVDGQVVGGINLYASTVDAFDGQVETLAGALGATAEEAVRNADLGFTSRDRARLGPRHLDEFDEVNQAAGYLGSARGIGPEAARKLLQDAALQAGLTESQVARVLIAILTD